MNTYQCPGHRNVQAASFQDAANIFASRLTKSIRFGSKYSLSPTGFPEGSVIYKVQVQDNLGGVLYENNCYTVSLR